MVLAGGNVGAHSLATPLDSGTAAAAQRLERPLPLRSLRPHAPSAIAPSSGTPQLPAGSPGKAARIEASGDRGAVEKSASTKHRQPRTRYAVRNPLNPNEIHLLH